ncbi:MAG TPA: hypothetical protein VK695_00515 [Steroidobacteraceae bacterium]|jgi:hypothetical protein|nr:hypothetical protein [Steroidobacteraceae bacterium]
MRELVRLFTQIAVLRKGPQDVPVSALLLALTLLGYLAVNFLITSALPVDRHWPDEHWQGPLLVDSLFILLWYVVLLRLVKRPERTLQTVTAVFGVQAVLSPLLIGTEWLLRRYGEDATWNAPVTFLGLLLLAWLIAAYSHVVKAALEWSGSASVALVILQMLASWLVLFAVFPPGKS